MTVKQLNNKLENIKVSLPKIIAGTQQAALNLMIGTYKTRIFESGLDSNNKSLGGYSKQWKKWRIKLGRYAEKKNLSFSDLLSGSIIVGNYQNRLVLGMVKNQYRRNKFYPVSKATIRKPRNSYKVNPLPNTVQVSEYLEQQHKSPVFEPTKNEIEIAKKEAERYITAQVLKLFK